MCTAFYRSKLGVFDARNRRVFEGLPRGRIRVRVLRTRKQYIQNVVGRAIAIIGICARADLISRLTLVSRLLESRLGGTPATA